MPLRLLLLQAREADDPMRDHERECFVDRLGLRHDQVHTHNLVTHELRYSEVKRYDALLMGGSGEFLVSKGDQPNFEPLLDLLREIVDEGHPMFATCYGFQAMVHAVGGRVIHDPEQVEVGTFDLQLTEAGRRDELLGELPPQFKAQQGHKDRAEHLPPNLLHLAYSERCPHQALRVKDKPIWAVQFHPELDEHGNRSRYVHYLEHYAPHLTPEEVERELECFDHSPEASSLLSRFLRLVFG